MTNCGLCNKPLLKNDDYATFKTHSVCNLEWKRRTVDRLCGNCGTNKLPEHSNSVCDSCYSSSLKPQGYPGP